MTLKTNISKAGLYRGFVSVALVVALSACGQREPAETTSSPGAPIDSAAPAQAMTFFICDGVDAPVILVASEPEDGRDAVSLREFNKISRQFEPEHVLTNGEEEGAAGSTYSSLMENGADYAVVRRLNPGVLGEPSAAYTDPVTSVRIGTREIGCRWYERARVNGFTNARSLVVTEDADGDLILRTFDFSEAANARRIDLDGAQRSTVFTREIRGGTEETGPEGAIFRFAQDGMTYVVGVPDVGEASFSVQRSAGAPSNETLLAVQTPPKNE